MATAKDTHEKITLDRKRRERILLISEAAKEDQKNGLNGEGYAGGVKHYAVNRLGLATELVP